MLGEDHLEKTTSVLMSLKKRPICVQSWHLTGEAGPGGQNILRDACRILNLLHTQKIVPFHRILRKHAERNCWMGRIAIKL